MKRGGRPFWGHYQVLGSPAQLVRSGGRCSYFGTSPDYVCRAAKPDRSRNIVRDAAERRVVRANAGSVGSEGGSGRGSVAAVLSAVPYSDGCGAYGVTLFGDRRLIL